MERKIKVLQVAAVDVTVKYLLLPLIDRLIEEGYEVHASCSDGPRARELIARGYRIHRVPIARRIISLSHLGALRQLYRFMRRERFDIVHVHTPVAAVLGRIAARLAGVPIVIYTAHGFYFHENMHPWQRRLLIWIERCLGRVFTDWTFTQSREDYETALREGIARDSQITWIGNGTDTQRFLKTQSDSTLRAALRLGEKDRVVGFIGRLVREKGMEDLLLAMKEIVQEIPNTKLLVVGDTLDSDRDRAAKERIRVLLRKHDLTGVVRFAGHREDIPEVLALMDVFVLPSYREGMPRSIIEAMAAGKPVVATDIRGCREEVVHGITGLLVPVRDPQALADAIIMILRDPELAQRMGQAGRARAIAEFDERLVLERQMQVYTRLVTAAIHREGR